ncbi:MAG: hypothetical protein HFJ87_09910 [Muribaculaceae bacterium]|nr:hypothetical protein [Muribaculaceae bacterium]
MALACAMAGGATVNPSDADRAKCFIDNDAEQTVTFIMDNNLWKVSGINKLQVYGSFTSWGAKSEFLMTYDQEGNFWYVTVPYSSVKIPGNSGQPEFKFVANGSNYLNGGSKSFIPEGYVFLNGDKNNIVVFNDDDLETIKANSRSANVLKKVSDFDLTTEAGQEEISNFRRVPATDHLYRSYHPYKVTKTSNATEPLRMQYVAELGAAHGIKCDICLSENEERNLQSFTIAGTKFTETIPAYYQDIIDNGRVLYVGATNSVPTYNVVYYTPESSKFGTWVKEIVRFIIDDSHPAPFQIHCRIGTDRTGAFSGLIAALCGASWDEIATDYQLTNRMGIQEFRDYHLLQYSFQRLLGVDDIRDVEDLGAAISDYFISNGYLTADEISRLKAKLTDSTSSVADALADDAAPSGIYNFQGVRVADTADNLPAGLYVSRRGAAARKIVIR